MIESQRHSTRKLSLFHADLLSNVISLSISLIFLYLFGIPLVVFCDGEPSSEGETEAGVGAQEAGGARPLGESAPNPEGEPSSSLKRRVDPGYPHVGNDLEPAANPPRGQPAFSPESSFPSLPSIEPLPSIDRSEGEPSVQTQPPAAGPSGTLQDDRRPEAEIASSAPRLESNSANRGGETSLPAMSQQGGIPGENEPGRNAPQPPGGGEGEAVAPADERMTEEIRGYLNHFRPKRGAPARLINSLSNEINLTQASASKRQAILSIIENIRTDPRSITGGGVINSGENARAELTERLDRWVAEHEPPEQ